MLCESRSCYALDAPLSSYFSSVLSFSYSLVFPTCLSLSLALAGEALLSDSVSTSLPLLPLV